ncbi:MAG: PAS domain-containing protein [Desulfobaccales bacterium]
MFTKTITVLLVEDNPGDARLIREMLATQEDANFRLEWVDRLADGLERLDRGGVDVVLLDLGLPDSYGLDTFIRAYARSPRVPFVVLTGLADETVGVIAVRQGAQDYLIKGEVEGGLLLRSIRYAAERKRTEEALRESEESYRLLVNQVPAVVFKGYEDWRVDFFDEKVEALTGYSKEDFDSRRLKWCDVILPEDLDYASSIFIDALKTNRAYVREHRIRRKDGEIRWIQCRGQIFCDAQGKIDYISGVTFDITDRKRIEEALREARDALEQRVADRTADLSRVVGQLQQEVERRRQAEEDLQKAHDDLELKVAMRTAELAQTNQQLQQEVNERRRAEEALEAEHQRLFSLLDALPAFVYVKAKDYSIRFANRIFRETFGSPDVKRCYEVVHQREEPCPDCPSFKVLMTNMSQDWEMTWANGTRIYQVFNYPFADIDGSPLVLTLGVDITARKWAEEELKVSEARFRELFKSMSNGVAVFKARDEGRDFVFTDYNRAAELIDKIKKEDLLGRSVLEIFPGVRDFGLFEVFQRVWRTGKAERHPVSFYQDQRVQGWRENYVYKLASGEIVSVFEDITERKQAEESLRQSEARLAEAQRIVHLGSWEWDVANNEAIWSDEMFRILNMPVQERGLNYKEFFEQIHPEDREKTRKAIDAALAGAKPYSEDIRILPKGGGVKTVSIAAEVIFDGTTKKPVRMQGTLQDITERRTAEVLLQESEKNLRYLASQLLTAQEKERKRISRDLHDVLGQSLLCLKLQARAVGKEIETAPQQIKSGYDQMLSDLDDLIDTVRRLSRDISPQVLEDLGITSAFKNLFNKFKKHHGMKNCTLDIDEIDGLFSQEDQINIYRIFQEALTNIGKYARATQISGIVKRREDEVFFQVEDDGLGFDVDRVLTVNPAGRGMGLASMQERARMLGGRLHLWSEMGKGTRISFSIPLAQNLRRPIRSN